MYKGSLNIDYNRNNLLSEAGKKSLETIMQIKMDFQDLFAYVASFYSNDQAHAQRMYDYFSTQLFMVSTPILANIPLKGFGFKGHPISCFISESEKNENFSTINTVYNETSFFSTIGGGLGTLWKTPVIGEMVNGIRSYSILSYLQTQGRLMRLSSGFARKVGALATYLHISNAEIKSFIDMRKPAAGTDPETYVPRFIHHGIVISDDFMDAVKKGLSWNLLNSKEECVETVNARNLFVHIIKTRLETGEPFLLFEGNVNRKIPEDYKRNNLRVNCTNLCTEITLATNKDRVAICCLGSINVEKEIPDQLYEDVLRFFDNILSFFITEDKEIGEIINYEEEFGYCLKLKKKEADAVNKAKITNHPLKRAIFSAFSERSIGIGVTGFDNYLKSRGIIFESQAALELNKTLFNNINNNFYEANKRLAQELGPCADSKDLRFVHCTAIAPTTNISLIQNTSACIEPQMNIFVLKNLSGSIIVKNNVLLKELQTRGLNTEEFWDELMQDEQNTIKKYLGSSFLELFKSPYDVDQNFLVQMAADRKIDQSQSLNLYYKHDASLHSILKLHIDAYNSGIKTIYYLRSTSKIDQSNFAKIETNNFVSNLKIPTASNVENRFEKKIQCIGCES